MSVWILSIVGIVVLTVMVDIIIPEGESNKYIKSIMAIVTVFIIFQPLPALLKSDFDFSTVFNCEEISTDQTLSDGIYCLRLGKIENDVSVILLNNNVKNFEIDIVSNNNNSFVEINKIVINISKSVIDGNSSHINNTDKIIELISKTLNIDKGKIIIYE